MNSPFLLIAYQHKDATLIHAKMEEPVTKVPVLVLQTLLDQNVNIKLVKRNYVIL